MIRIRNPISNIDVLINVFKKLYFEFSNVEYFDLDNIAEFFAREKLASSSGYIGNEALKRSYQIKDDSRKSMKMQSKSYAEIYRILGWIHSTEGSALKFKFTYLGVHVAISGEASKDLFEQCLLGITYPNNNVNVKFNDINKPFISMLKFAEKLDGIICRDEILLSAMNMKDGRSEEEFDEKLTLIKSLRETKNINCLKKSLKDLSDSLNISVVATQNLTRFVISALSYSGWFKKIKSKTYGSSSAFLELTEKGASTCNYIDSSIDLYGIDLINTYDQNKISDISNFSFLCMLENADFNVDNEIDKYISIRDDLSKVYNKSSILFSPFQFFSNSQIADFMPDKIIETTDNKIDSNIDFSCADNSVLFKSNKSIDSFKSINNTEFECFNKSEAERIIQSYYNKNNDIEVMTKKFLYDIQLMKQSDFYPLVSNFLSYIFNRKTITPSAGNNNLRFDVIIIDDKYSIPVEVKSPTEEMMLSVKAIRQALENKIILLSREAFNTEFNISSIAIGYSIPNKRSDVYKLIDDIYKTYKINIAISDMSDLFKAAFYCYINNTKFNINSLIDYRGRIEFNYEDI